MEFNWLGVSHTAENLGEDVAGKISEYMERLAEESAAKFEQWLDSQNLECVMGVIVKKGSIPQPKRNAFDNFTRYKGFRICPDKTGRRFAVYHESDLKKPIAMKDTQEDAMSYIDIISPRLYWKYKEENKQ